jgi:hypothetical protein
MTRYIEQGILSSDVEMANIKLSYFSHFSLLYILE